MTEKEISQFENYYLKKPHLVILGAGATMATIPNGDKFGKKSSCMNNFLSELGLQNLLDGIDIHTNSTNIEKIYSELHERSDCSKVVRKIEDTIYDYFSSLVIPDNVTIYDLLILSLRKKDCIATFNWDSLLVQAYNRISRFCSDLPKILYLHGNVGIKICDSCHKVIAITDGDNCPFCGKKLTPTWLLYPVAKKNYDEDPFIHTQWKQFEQILPLPAVTTIFGYGAPPSDTLAIEKLKKAFLAFGQESRQFDEIEIIEKPGAKYKDVNQSWWDLSALTYDHMTLQDNFFNSYLARNPRRTIEHAKAHNLDGMFAHAYCKWDAADLNDDFESLKWYKKISETLQYERTGNYSIIIN